MNKYTLQWKTMSSIIRLLLLIYATCFLIGGSQHWLDIFTDGLFPYRSLPWIFNIFLTLLAVIDVIVSIMFFVRPIIGLFLAMLIMASDLFVDFYASYFYWHIAFVENRRLQLLVIFGLFVFISAPLIILWLINNKRNEK